MVKQWIGLINLCIGALGLIFLLAALWVMFLRPSEIQVMETAAVRATLPKGAFALPREAYDAIGEPVLNLKYAPMAMQLPDLRRSLIYYGKNGRPDASLEHPVMYFAFTGNKTPAPVPENERIYLLYDKKLAPPQYVFSPGNAETSLWFEAALQGNQALVKVGMKNDAGQILNEPQAYAQFTLPEKEFVRVGGTPWEIGKYRVDGTLLARQRARWYGTDKFLERHGGKEYAYTIGKQRIDFGEGDDIYSIFVGPGDAAIWDGSRWKVVEPGEKSLGYPLMVVKKIDERLMTFELWDVGGKSKILLNLLKTTEPVIPQNVLQSFKFVGARTRSQFVFEINKERMLLSPQDWLLYTDKGWKKLVTPEEVDAYVDRKTPGLLFVFDGVEKRDEGQFIVGTLYNAARTDMQHVVIPMQQNGTPGIPSPSKEESGKAKQEAPLPSQVQPSKPEPDDEKEDVPAGPTAANMDKIQGKIRLR